MNIRSIATIALLLIAGLGMAYVFVGGSEDGGEPVAENCAPTSDCSADCKSKPGAAKIDAPASDLPKDGVVVYYFHGTQRCFTCNKMESLAEVVLDTRFAEKLAAGSVVFKPINTEEDANRHFVNDFSLVTKAVVMVERKDGQDVTWRKLDQIWDKISEDEIYQEYIAENLTACLDHLESDAS